MVNYFRLRKQILDGDSYIMSLSEFITKRIAFICRICT